MLLMFVLFSHRGVSFVWEQAVYTGILSMIRGIARMYHCSHTSGIRGQYGFIGDTHLLPLDVYLEVRPLL